MSRNTGNGLDQKTDFIFRQRQTIHLKIGLCVFIRTIAQE